MKSSCSSRLSRCLEKTFREHFWGALWGRVQNKKSGQRKDKGQRKPYRRNKPRAGDERILWAERLTALVPEGLVNDVGIETSLGRWRQCHPVEEWSRILTVEYNKDNVKGEAYHPLKRSEFPDLRMPLLQHNPLHIQVSTGPLLIASWELGLEKLP